MKRKILFYGKYFFAFYEKQERKVKNKIDYVIDIIRNVDKVPIKFLKYFKGTDNLYEVRILTSLKQIRIFCFFDEGKVIILANCFVKKSKKTPKKDLELAVKLKKEYFDNKQKGDKITTKITKIH